jgi:hypothetical protein
MKTSNDRSKKLSKGLPEFNQSIYYYKDNEFHEWNVKELVQ